MAAYPVYTVQVAEGREGGGERERGTEGGKEEGREGERERGTEGGKEEGREGGREGGKGRRSVKVGQVGNRYNRLIKLGNRYKWLVELGNRHSGLVRLGNRYNRLVRLGTGHIQTFLEYQHTRSSQLHRAPTWPTALTFPCLLSQSHGPSSPANMADSPELPWATESKPWALLPCQHGRQP